MSKTLVSVVIPCLNEEDTIAGCVRRARQAFAGMKAPGEVVVVDNGSADRSAARAKSAGARVIAQPVKGYGSALMGGIAAARGQYLVMADADATYNFADIPKFIEALRGGADLVMGSRLKGRIAPGAMPWLHRYVGTPFLTAVLNWFYGTRISDANCGMRGFTRAAVQRLGLRCRGMEFASEMVVKAAQLKLKIRETPIDYAASPPGRVPKLNTFRDGWRHLRFMLMLSPENLFLLPGLVLAVLGAALSLLLFVRTVVAFGYRLGLSAEVFANALFLMGIQVMLFGVYAIIFNTTQGLSAEDRVSRWVNKYFRLEWGLMLGAALMALGLGLGAVTIGLLAKVSQTATAINVPITQLAIVATFTLLLGLQIFFSSFYLSLFNLRKTLE